MRASRIAAGLAALWVGVVVTAASAQKPEGQSNWWPNWWGTTKPKAEAKDHPKPGEDRAAEMAKIESAYNRWCLACERLQQLAVNKDDTALFDEATRLNELADEVRNAKIEALNRRLTAEPAPKDGVLNETVKVMAKQAGVRRSGGAREGER